jgi:hypothetical protein
MKFKILLFTFLGLLFLANQSHAQYTTKKIKSKHQIYTDSLKQVEYNYTFPFLGQEAYKRGFDIPYPAGIMGNYVWMQQGILIDNMQLGLKTDDRDIPLTPVDFLEFGKNVSTANSFNIRPDLWVLPFLNVYGLLGRGQSQTEVNLVVPFALKSIVDQSFTTAGFGVMAAGGIGPVWFSVDANWTWNKPELLEKAVRVNVLGIRVGHTFTFKNKPQSNIAVWAGGMRAELNSETRGEIKLGDALPPEVWERRDEIVTNYWDWYNNQANIGQKIIADKILTPIVERLETADGSAIIRYGLDKRLKEKWNGIIGAQYQMNKRWMIRSEAGIFGDRKSFLLSINYRFLM